MDVLELWEAPDTRKGRNIDLQNPFGQATKLAIVFF